MRKMILALALMLALPHTAAAQLGGSECDEICGRAQMVVLLCVASDAPAGASPNLVAECRSCLARSGCGDNPAATIQSPKPGTKLVNVSETFVWTTPANAEFQLVVTTVGGAAVFSSAWGRAAQATVPKLPGGTAIQVILKTRYKGQNPKEMKYQYDTEEGGGLSVGGGGGGAMMRQAVGGGAAGTGASPGAPVQASADRVITNPAPAGAPVQLRVSAQRPWTDTGVNVRPGMKITITASGSIATAPGSSVDPNGDVLGGRFASGLPLPSAPLGALIATLVYQRGGNSQVLVVGRQNTFLVEPNEYGRLWVGINDSNCADNTGEFVVTIDAR